MSYWIVGAIVLIGGVIWLAVAEEASWQTYAQAHCTVTGKVSGSTSTGWGIGANGKGGMVTTYTPGKTGYTCDDGVTYWR